MAKGDLRGSRQEISPGVWRIFISDGFQDGKRRVASTVVKPTNKRGDKLDDLHRRFIASVEDGSYWVEKAAKKEQSQPKEKPLTFKDYSDKWLSRKKSEIKGDGFSPKTYNFYERIIRTRIIPHFGEMQPYEITPLVVREFFDSLLEDRGRLDGREGDLSNTTIKHVFNRLKAILEDMNDMEIIPSNPCRKVRPPKIKKVEPNYLDIDQVKKMVACLEKEHIRYQAVLMLALNSGMRRGELMGLTWKDIDTQKNLVTINKSVVYIPGEGVIEKGTKTEGSNRTIKIPAHVVTVLNKWKTEQSKERLAMGSKWKAKDYIFTNPYGERMNMGRVLKWFKGFLKDNQIPDIRFHDIRHCHATILLAEGVDIKTVSKRLGHSSSKMTHDVYVHALESADQKASEALENLFGVTENRG